MTTTPPIPQSMIEAVATALHDIDCTDKTCSATIMGSVYAPRARRVLAAALGVCEVREEYGTKIWVDDAEAQDDWFAGSCREIAMDRVRLHAERRAANPPSEQVNARRWHGNARLIRRLHIATPAEQVDP